MNSKENFEEFWERCLDFFWVSKPSVIVLRSVSKIRNRNEGLIVLVPEKIEELFI